ncbi:hypothetical protein ACFR97_10315 [Haloplanus litoreus]|uniref:Uncharacterized protein n=1 Tax=Haloplanus litoreus TaxID=767515 RepID=A0ABD6A3D4_9EURY
MTKAFEKIQEGPQTEFGLGDFNYEERTHVRQIRISGRNTREDGAAFNAVVYLEGDDKRAAQKFVEVNREELEQIDATGRNFLQDAVAREIYDWILHYLGERKLEKFETVVREARPDGTIWIIDRDRYEEHHNRRYTASESGVVKLTDTTPMELFESFGPLITWSNIDDHDCIEAHTPVTLLEYYRVSPEYSVEPLEISRETEQGRQTEPALRKVADEAPAESPETPEE